MEAWMEKELDEMLELATTLVSEGRKPTDEERARFLELKGHIGKVSGDWKSRLIDQIDRFAAMLEGMGI